MGWFSDIFGPSLGIPTNALQQFDVARIQGQYAQAEPSSLFVYWADQWRNWTETVGSYETAALAEAHNRMFEAGKEPE